MWKLWRVGKIFGIPLMIHGTFVLLMAFYAISGLLSGGVPSAVLNLALALTVFAVIVLHELGHLAAYRRYGLRAKDIILTPLGGIARGIGQLGSQTRPWQEFVIAAAGPAVNVALAGLTWLALRLTPWAELGSVGPFSLALTEWFLNVNLFLLLFNLIPALPMDGGRMLRAALTHRLGFLKATQVAARVARWATLAMAIYALATGSLSLLLVAGMIFVMSWLEVAQAHVGEVQRRSPLFTGFPGGFEPQAGSKAPAGGTVVDQYGNPVDGWPSGTGWSSAEHVQPTPDGRGWTVRSVRWLE
jgi:Zn-dependent protease